MNPGAQDRRSVAELFEAALGAENEDLRWDAVMALHWRGSREVFDRAAALCRSSDAQERALGAEILGQLGIPARTYPEESFDVLLALLSDSDASVLNSAIVSLGHVDAASRTVRRPIA